MKFDHLVKHNGKYYPMGTDVPIGDTEPIEKKIGLVKVESDKKAYSKTEINRLSTSDLQKLAKTEGIEEADNLSGSQLKKMLIKHFAL